VDDPEAIDLIRHLINAAGYQVVQEGTAGHAYETTTIACPPAFDDEAARMAHQLSVDASIVPAIPHPGYDLTLYIGEDFAPFELERALRWIGHLVEARRNGDAERFLAPSSRDDYFETSGRAEPRPGELYLYPEEGIARFLVVGWDRLGTETWRFQIRFRWNGGCVVNELIWIDMHQRGDHALTSARLSGILDPDCLSR
jgi:hypothetical protein